MRHSKDLGGEGGGLEEARGRKKGKRPKRRHTFIATEETQEGRKGGTVRRGEGGGRRRERGLRGEKGRKRRGQEGERRG